MRSSNVTRVACDSTRNVRVHKTHCMLNTHPTPATYVLYMQQEMLPPASNETIRTQNSINFFVNAWYCICDKSWESIIKSNPNPHQPTNNRKTRRVRFSSNNEISSERRRKEKAKGEILIKRTNPTRYFIVLSFEGDVCTNLHITPFLLSSPIWRRVASYFTVNR